MCNESWLERREKNVDDIVDAKRDSSCLVVRLPSLSAAGSFNGLREDKTRSEPLEEGVSSLMAVRENAGCMVLWGDSNSVLLCLEE